MRMKTCFPSCSSVSHLFKASLLASIVLLASNAGAVPQEPWLSTTPTTSTLYGVAFGAGQFVAVGASGTILTSTDGANWTVRVEATNQVTLYAVTYGANGFIAVGAAGSPSEPVVWTSPDGTAWTAQDVSSLNLPNGNWLQGVTYGKGLYVAVGGNYNTNTVVTSTNGVDWTPHDSSLSNTGLSPLGGVAYGNGVFVAVGAWLITSEDGVVWTKQNSSAWYRLYAITFGDGRFVGVGPYSRICSTNGTNWVVGTPLTGDYIYGVTYGDGFFVCLGFKPNYTANGTNWVAQVNGFSGNAIAYGNGVFVAVGASGQTYRTASATHLSLQKAATANLTLTALVPGTYRIDGNSDMANTNGWSPLSTLFLTNSPALWTDESSSNVLTRFYRAVPIP